jgi:hypothetical protein
MTHDELLTGALVVSFATLATAHVALVTGLVARKPRWRAPVAAIVLPLAPVWGFRAAMPVRSAAWIAGAVAYIVTRWLARV